MCQHSESAFNVNLQLGEKEVVCILCSTSNGCIWSCHVQCVQVCIVSKQVQQWSQMSSSSLRIDISLNARQSDANPGYYQYWIDIPEYLPEHQHRILDNSVCISSSSHKVILQGYTQYICYLLVVACVSK